MPRTWALAATLCLLACAAARAGSPLKNGSFEAARTVEGAASVDQGFGLWTLGPGRLAPSHWTLNTAYPGECSVLSGGARSGERFLRLRGTAKGRDAHVYQPCSALQAGIQSIGHIAYVQDGHDEHLRRFAPIVPQLVAFCNQ